LAQWLPRPVCRSGRTGFTGSEETAGLSYSLSLLSGPSTMSGLHRADAIPRPSAENAGQLHQTRLLLHFYLPLFSISSLRRRLSFLASSWLEPRSVSLHPHSGSMATETLDGLSALLRGLDLGGMPQFPSADVLHQPIDIFHVYLADTLQKLVGCDPQHAYEAIQPADKTSNGDLDIVLPKLKLPDGPDLHELAADLVKKVGQYPTLPLNRPVRATSFVGLPANTRVGTLLHPPHHSHQYFKHLTLCWQ